MTQSSYLSIIGPNGSGKTTFAANLGLAFARLGYDVLIVDNNLFPALGFHFNIPFPNRTIQNSLKENNIEKMLYKHPSGLKLLLSSPLGKYEKINFDLLEGLAQIIIIDGKKFKNNIVLVNPNMPSIMNAIKNKIDANTVGIVLNKINSINMTDESVAVLANRDNLLTVDFENAQKDALKQGVPLFEMDPESIFSTKLLKMASKLIGQEYEMLLENDG